MWMMILLLRVNLNYLKGKTWKMSSYSYLKLHKAVLPLFLKEHWDLLEDDLSAFLRKWNFPMLPSLMRMIGRYITIQNLIFNKWHYFQDILQTRLNQLRLKRKRRISIQMYSRSGGYYIWYVKRKIQINDYLYILMIVSTRYL